MRKQVDQDGVNGRTRSPGAHEGFAQSHRCMTGCSGDPIAQIPRGPNITLSVKTEDLYGAGGCDVPGLGCSIDGVEDVAVSRDAHPGSGCGEV